MDLWKTAKVFVSSTFQDLELERDQLAQVFVRIKRKIAARRLALISYDLRWRERHTQQPVEKWCVEMVEQCQYFVAILGYRYGWRPPQDARGQPNTHQLSITEMEIETALATTCREKRFFCIADMSQYSEQQLASESEQDKKSLQSLKQRLLQNKERVYEYKNIDNVLEIIEQRLQKLLDADYPPHCPVPLIAYTHVQALEDIIAQKIRGFIGRRTYLQTLENFALANTTPNYLALCAIAGTGKSSLLASFIDKWKTEHPRIPVIAHFMSMGGDSRRLHGLMSNLGEQLLLLGIISGALQDDPLELRIQVRNALEKTQQRLIVAIDGLDEIEESAKELSWLSHNIPSNVRVIVTTRPVSPWEKLQSYVRLKALELPPLEAQEITDIITNYAHSHQLALSDSERQLLQKRACGNPLYLKVALEEIVSTGIAVGELATSVESLFEQILTRLQHAYSWQLIQDYLGLIAAARNGLAEVELKELLPEISDELFLSISKSLENFVICRSGLWNFFHPEFERSIKQRLGKQGMRNYHQRLAVYFASKGLEYERTLNELCYQQQWAEEYAQLLKTLTDLHFLEAKCGAGMVDNLAEDFTRALNDATVTLPSDLRVETEEGICVSRYTLKILSKALSLDLRFLRRHNDCLFQSLWNRCYWYDAPQATNHYHSEARDALPSQISIYPLVEKWRLHKEQCNTVWLQSKKPLEPHLDTAPGKMLKGHQGWVNTVAVSADGKRIASGSDDRDVRLWDVKSGECLAILHGHEDDVVAVALTADGKRVISGSEDKTIRIWDGQSGDCLQVLREHQGTVESVCLTKDGRLVVSGSADKTIRIWDMDSGKCISCIGSDGGHRSNVTSVAVSADGKFILSGSSDSTLRLWDMSTGKCLRILSGHQKRVYAVALSNNGNLAASGSRDDTTRIWELSSGKCLHVLSEQWGVFGVAFSEDDQSLATTSGDKKVTIWDVASGRCLQKYEWHERTVTAAAFIPHSSLLVSASRDKVLCIGELTSKSGAKLLKGHTAIVYGLNFSADGKQLATGSQDNTIIIWDVASGESQKTLLGHKGRVWCVAFNPDASKLVSGSTDRTVAIWDIKNSKLLASCVGHSSSVYSVAFSNDGTKVASASEDYTVRIWEVATGNCLQVLQGHDGYARCVAFNDDGTLIASGAKDATVRIWDVATGNCLHVFTGHKDVVRSVAFQSNNTEIVSSSRDKTVRVWQLADGQGRTILSDEVDASNVANQRCKFYGAVREVETVVLASSGEAVACCGDEMTLPQTTIHGELAGRSQGFYVYLFKLCGIMNGSHAQ